MKTHRHTVAVLATPGIVAARDVYVLPGSDVVKVATLVEIAAAAATMARAIVRIRHLDLDLIAPHVVDRTDLRAVLGRGQWLPTMTRRMASPVFEPVEIGTLLPAVLPDRPRRTRGELVIPGQRSLLEDLHTADVGEG